MVVAANGGTGPAFNRSKEGAMHAIIRSYTDPDLADLLATNRAGVEELISGVPGVQNYVLIRTPDGCVSVTVGDDEAATSASSAAAAGFLRDKGATAPPPTITTGEVIAHVGAGVTA